MESSNGNLRGDLLQRKTFDTLLEANGALREMAAAHQHDPTTQRLGLPAQGASRRGSPVRSLEGQNPNLENSVIHGGRSKPDRRSEGGSDGHLRIDSGSWREETAPGCSTT